MKKGVNTIKILCIDFENKIVTVDKHFPDISNDPTIRKRKEEAIASLNDHPPIGWVRSKRKKKNVSIKAGYSRG